ncbi:MAG: sulfatase [Planctomycetes bacterium]|nr:sulfatase [Planctomycetota bacterium]
MIRTLALFLWLAGPLCAEKANVVLVSIDTVRADHLGCYGYPRPTSPALDAFAAQGVLFRNATCQAPWTLPSHMAAFTGQYPSTNGVNDLSKQLGEKKYTLAHIFQINGYETVALVNDGNLKRHWGCDRGFDTWQEFSAIEPEGEATHITAQAIQWLEARTRKKDAPPFFLFLHYFDPHDPYSPPEPYDRMFAPDYGGSIRPGETADILYHYRSPARNIENPADLAYLQALYDGEIRYLDDSLGRLFQSLKSLGYDPNTVVAVFSDHGEEFEEHLSTTHGATLYEEVIRVAFLVRSPFRLKPGIRIDYPVELVDLMPTLLDLLGLAPFPGAQGESLLGLIEGEAGPRFRFVRSETTRVLEACALRSLRTPRFKYIYSLLDGREELFDLDADAAEKLNVADRKADILEFFRSEMKAWTGRSADFWRLRFPPGNKPGPFSGTLRPVSGQLGVIFPVGLDDNDEFAVSREWDRIQFRIRPGPAEKGVYFEVLDSRAPVTLEFEPTPVRFGHTASTRQISASPVTLGPEESLSGPFVLPAALGLNPDGAPCLQHFRGPHREEAAPARAAELDDATREMLRTLGYIK